MFLLVITLNVHVAGVHDVHGADVHGADVHDVGDHDVGAHGVAVHGVAVHGVARGAGVHGCAGVARPALRYLHARSQSHRGPHQVQLPLIHPWSLQHYLHHTLPLYPPSLALLSVQLSTRKHSAIPQENPMYLVSISERIPRMPTLVGEAVLGNSRVEIRRGACRGGQSEVWWG